METLCGADHRFIVRITFWVTVTLSGMGSHSIEIVYVGKPYFSSVMGFHFIVAEAVSFIADMLCSLRQQKPVLKIGSGYYKLETRDTRKWCFSKEYSLI